MTQQNQDPEGAPTAVEKLQQSRPAPELVRWWLCTQRRLGISMDLWLLCGHSCCPISRGTIYSRFPTSSPVTFRMCEMKTVHRDETERNSMFRAVPEGNPKSLGCSCAPPHEVLDFRLMPQSALGVWDRRGVQTTVWVVKDRADYGKLCFQKGLRLLSGILFSNVTVWLDHSSYPVEGKQICAPWSLNLDGLVICL